METRIQEKLSPFHLAILIYMTQSGMVIFSLSRRLAEQFGTNGWLAVPLVSLIVCANILLMAVVYRMGKGKSIFDIMEQSISKIILFPLYLFLLLVWSLIGCLVAKQYLLVFQMIAFPTTNPMLFKLVFDILAFSLIIKGVYNISKAAAVFFWSIIWMVFLLFYFYYDFKWARLTPFIFQDSTITIQSFSNIYLAFLGIELCLLLFPYINKKSKFTKSILAANLFVTLMYTYLGFVSFGFYGHNYLKTLQFPLLSMFAYIQFPFVQGTEILFYGFFMFSIIITSVMYLWAAKETCARIIPINGKLITAGILLFSYFVAYIPDVMSVVEKWLTVLGYFEFGISFGLPLFLISLLLLQRMRGERSE
ncbi:GerAB/ArcD/ProY family transporter [Paenibacillus sp. GXUN7292]|uniref:GerAB/ArcD/ProY family transporter n=1 Tax=Paenibacillus sp. GXUN7292 TaxID=3422499 RepID=UPI003D7DD1B0